MQARTPYLSGDLDIEGLAAMLEVVARGAAPTDGPATARRQAMRRGWIDADGLPTNTARLALRELIDADADDISSAAVQGAGDHGPDTARGPL